MLFKRIIPCLDIKDGQVVKGVRFKELRFAGDAVTLGKKYAAQGADELVFLDITATHEKRKTLADLARRVAEQINIPFTVGGGVNSIEDIRVLLDAGADKVTINSAAVKNPELIRQAAEEFGGQCIVVAIDAQQEPSTKRPDFWRVYTSGGRTPTTYGLQEWAEEVETLGAGEILFTSMNHDGTKSGFAVSVYRELSEKLSIPIIASGGGGTTDHFEAVLREGVADAALAASIFHFDELPVPQLKKELVERGVHVR
ncbi:MAG: imidazole glycerol phosphate synthase subunit HisF [Bacteroidota bacterium]